MGCMACERSFLVEPWVIFIAGHPECYVDILCGLDGIHRFRFDREIS